MATRESLRAQGVDLTRLAFSLTPCTLYRMQIPITQQFRHYNNRETANE